MRSWPGHAAAKEDWWKLTGALAMIVVATGSAFAGPANVWGVLAIGGCSLLLGQGVLRFWWSRLRLDGPAPAAAESPALTADDPLDPLIHVPARLRIVATLAALRVG